MLYISYAIDPGEYNAHIHGVDASMDAAKARVKEAINNGTNGVYDMVAVVDETGKVIREEQV